MLFENKMLRAVTKNIVQSLLIIGVIFLITNRAYFLYYLPHQGQYREVQAYIKAGFLRGGDTEVVLAEPEEPVEGIVKKAFWEKSDILWGDKITVGYSAELTPHIVRIHPVITWGMLGVVIALVAANTALFIRMRKIEE